MFPFILFGCLSIFINISVPLKYTKTIQGQKCVEEKGLLFVLLHLILSDCLSTFIYISDPLKDPRTSQGFWWRSICLFYKMGRRKRVISLVSLDSFLINCQLPFTYQTLPKTKRQLKASDFVKWVEKISSNPCLLWFSMMTTKGEGKTTAWGFAERREGGHFQLSRV